VVAVLDTGIGRHAWLGDDFVEHDVRVGRLPVGVEVASAQAFLRGVDDELTGELAADAGHGTFIAGIVRQACPEALLLDVPTYGDDGQVGEAELLGALQRLALRQVLARNGVGGHRPVDVVCLSLGYYHEQPGDKAFDALLLGPIQVLGRYGAAVVVSAGNDATSRPAFPAAFAPHRGGRVKDDPAIVPVSTVGARNPDGTIALFSNDGPWVKFLRPGASLVSTFPDSYDGSAEPSHVVRNRRGEVRSSFDPDDFISGFGVWSGTSFAAPVLAGELAAGLAALYREGERDLSTKAAVPPLRGLLAKAKGRKP
jgi:subtilisin family serine protease